MPSVLLTPTWVTPKNMNATVVKDNFVPASQLCAGSYASDCQAAGITRRNQGQTGTPVWVMSIQTR